MESYIIPTHLHIWQWFSTTVREKESEKSVQSIIVFWSLATGTHGCWHHSNISESFFKVNSISCFTTKLLRSSLFIHCFFYSWTFRKWSWGWLKQRGKSKGFISQECQRDVTWRLSFHVYKLSRQLHMEPGFSVIYLLDSGWPRGTVGKQLSSSIIREGKGKHKHIQVDIHNKVKI